MENHVNNEIALQLIIEKVVMLYQKIDATKNLFELNALRQEVKEALKQKRLIENGDNEAINKILNENMENSSQMGE